MSHVRTSLLTTTLVLGVLAAACGGGTESADDSDTTLARSSPVVSAISLGSTQPDVDRESATNAWSELTSGLAEGNFVAPFGSDGSLYALMESSALAPPPFDERFAIMKWNGESWVAVSGTQGPSCFAGSECYLDVVGDGEVTFPIVTITWCCPMGSAYRTEAMTSVFVIRNDRLDPLITDEENQFWAGDITPNFFEVDSCSSGAVRFIEEYGYEDFYCYRSKTTRFLVENGNIVDSQVTEVDIPDNPFEACIVDAPIGCLATVFVYTEDCTLDEIIIGDRFPLARCQYGHWVREFEQDLFDDGFAVDPDGFYLPSETAVVARAQLLAGLDSDGLIGPATWARFVEYAQCSDTLEVGGMPNDIVSCEYDMNGDGLYGPGDIVPD